jgi:hypothetical protein
LSVSHVVLKKFQRLRTADVAQREDEILEPEPEIIVPAAPLTLAAGVAANIPLEE